MKTIYSIIGRKRSGKDTIADYICKKKGCKKYALATPLKKLVCNVFGITMERLDMYKNEEWKLIAESGRKDSDTGGAYCLDVSFRSILQRTGDGMKDFFGISCYMKQFHHWMLSDNKDIAVVSDVRLREEQKWLTTHTSPIFIKVVRGAEKHQDLHRTETETDELGYDLIIYNNGTLEELYEKIDKILE